MSRTRRDLACSVVDPRLLREAGACGSLVMFWGVLGVVAAVRPT